jgi:protein-tyrosine phosphatase
MTDFHSHILPGIDDGSPDLETSLEMLTREAAQGVRRVVATPHFYPRYEDPEQFLHRRARAEEALRQAMAQKPGLPQLLVGAEVYYFPGISESEWLPMLTIQGTGALLIEMPPAPWSGAMYRELADIREKRGFIPVIAHVDRYIGRFRTFGIPEKLRELPVMVQANASFFLERSAQALKLLKADQIQLLGSDCHNLADRTPNLAEAKKQILKKLGPEILNGILDWENTVVSNR